jgi:urease accessory protein
MSWWQSFAQVINEPEHWLAMLAVGVWAALLGGRAAWALPITFPLATIFGSALGATTVPLSWAEAGSAASVALLSRAEAGAAASVVILGLLLASAVRPALPIAVLVVGLLALVHGYENGLEMPPMADPLSYQLGFVAAAVALHLIGFGLGRAMLPIGKWVGRLGGATVVLAGVALLMSATRGG